MSQPANTAKPLRIVMTGGGSGGHITPILAVAHQLKQLRPDCRVIYIGQKGDGLGDIPAQDPNIDEAYSVRAGKLRRYHGEGVRQLLDMPTVGKNLRDIGHVVTGLGQSYRLLRRLHPDVIFVKGGFVGVPVGLAAAKLGIPYITHDSDALPGLANRIIARWASLHAVALPKEVYRYPAAKTVTVGVPISHEFRQRTAAEIAGLRHELAIANDAQVVLVTGGGLGAQRLNQAMIRLASDMLASRPKLHIIHLAGRQHADEVRQQYLAALGETLASRVHVEGFTTQLYTYSAIADVVVTRAGGNSMAEFAAQAKACIVVPNPVLAGGHQLKNAQVLAERQAVLLVDEPSLAAGNDLALALGRLLDEPQLARRLAQNLLQLAQPDAARQLALLLLEEADSAARQAQKPTHPNKHHETVQTHQ
jgi:UDP-N-acetylglucosamine--N-acetylmuramyl-(pentapeptide) pyrophosphoryl-undecaprenol N-acetylglucosamine transferase